MIDLNSDLKNPCSEILINSSDPVFWEKIISENIILICKMGGEEQPIFPR